MNTSSKIAVAIGVIAVMIVYAGNPAIAEELAPRRGGGFGSGVIQHKAEEVKARIASRSAELKLRLKLRESERRERLSGRMLKLCQDRHDRIEKHAKNSTKIADKIADTFAAIADRVDQFKVDKAIDVENYQQLKADVESKKAAVDAAITAATGQSTTFDCNSTGPKAQLHDFISQMDNVRKALKEYRTSIKNLIHAVRQANGQHRQATDSAMEAS